MTPTLILIVLLCLAALSASSARPAVDVDERELRADLVEKRQTLNQLRERKCLSPRVYRWKPWQVPDRILTWVATVQTPAWIRDVRRRESNCVPHRDLWECLHSREGDWQDGGWPYWGGLQMGDWFLDTYMVRIAPGSVPPNGWVGPNGWTNAPTVVQQMKAAELGYRESGYSLAWLRGQWPRSSRHCAAGGVL